jgi:hypothetical protein
VDWLPPLCASNDGVGLVVSQTPGRELQRDTQPQAVGNCRDAFSPGGETPWGRIFAYFFVTGAMQ